MRNSCRLDISLTPVLGQSGNTIWRDEDIKYIQT